MEKLKELNDLKHTLIDAAKAEIAKGIDNVDTEEMGAVVDMIKDLASAEKDCMEACYYETVTEAMEDYSEDDPKGYRMGYDNWRYASGRFAPKGRGTRTGYTPTRTTTTNGSMRNGHMEPNMRMGYPTPLMDDMPYNMNGRMGYDKADEAMESLKEVWNEADDETKRTVKRSLREMLDKMGDE